MRSREEQIIYLGSRLFVGNRNLTDANCEAQRHIDEAIQRGRELERAERGDGHDSDCATHNEPAFPNGPCNCTKRDTERLDWLQRRAMMAEDVNVHCMMDMTGDTAFSIGGAYDYSLRATIDASMNAETSNG